jgi:hypothetical protein
LGFVSSSREIQPSGLLGCSSQERIRVADLVTLLKQKDTGSDGSVHFYFPNGSGDQQTINHIAIDASGFASKFEEFEKSCNSSQ